MKAVLTTILFIAVTANAHRGRGHHGPFGHRRGPPPPPFLRELSREARREYFKIYSNMSATIAEQKDEVKVWAEKYNVTEKQQAFEDNMTKFRDEIKQNVTHLIANLSAVHQEFSKIVENQQQTPEELRNALKDLHKKYPQAFKVLMFIHHELKPRSGTPRHHGRRPFGKHSPFHGGDFGNMKKDHGRPGEQGGFLGGEPDCLHRGPGSNGSSKKERPE